MYKFLIAPFSFLLIITILAFLFSCSNPKVKLVEMEKNARDSFEVYKQKIFWNESDIRGDGIAMPLSKDSLIKFFHDKSIRKMNAEAFILTDYGSILYRKKNYYKALIDSIEMELKKY